MSTILNSFQSINRVNCVAYEIMILISKCEISSFWIQHIRWNGFGDQIVRTENTCTVLEIEIMLGQVKIIHTHTCRNCSRCILVWFRWNAECVWLLCTLDMDQQFIVATHFHTFKNINVCQHDAIGVLKCFIVIDVR